MNYLNEIFRATKGFSGMVLAKAVPRILAMPSVLRFSLLSLSILWIGMVLQTSLYAQTSSQVLNGPTLDQYMKMQENLTSIYEGGSNADLARFLRSLATTQKFNIADLKAKIIEVNGPSGLIIHADSDSERVEDWNKTLTLSGFDFIKFNAVDGKNPSELGLSKSYSVWMWSRKLIIPTAVFVAAYVYGLYELPEIKNTLGLSAPTFTTADYMAPVIAAGIAGSILSLIFEVPRRWWNEEIFSSRLGPIYRGVSFLLAPILIRATEIIAILRPGEFSREHVPLSTAFIVPVLISAAASTLIIGPSDHILSRYEKRREISKLSHLIIDTMIVLTTSVGQIMYLSGQNPWPGLAILGGAFAFGSLPLALRTLVGQKLYEERTAYLAWRSTSTPVKMSRLKRFCATILGELSVRTSFASHSIRPGSAE